MYFRCIILHCIMQIFVISCTHISAFGIEEGHLAVKPIIQIFTSNIPNGPFWPGLCLSFNPPNLFHESKLFIPDYGDTSFCSELFTGSLFASWDYFISFELCCSICCLLALSQFLRSLFRNQRWFCPCCLV